MTTNDPSDFTPFLMGMLVMFFFAGVGNVSTFEQMLMITPKCQAGGIQGSTGAVTALGPLLIGVALTLIPAHVFYFVTASYCALYTVLCRMRYVRPSAPFPD